MYVCFRAVVGSPDRDCPDQVWESVHVVDVFHFIGGKGFCCVSEHVYDWLEFFYDVSDCVVVFEFVFNGNAEDFRVGVLDEFGGVDVKL